MNAKIGDYFGVNQRNSHFFVTNCRKYLLFFHLLLKLDIILRLIDKMHDALVIDFQNVQLKISI